MTLRFTWLLGPGVVLAALALVPLFLRPEVALVLTGAGMVAWAAWRSVAYPMALAAIPPILFGILGDNPLPEGAVGIAIAGAVVLAVAVAVHRRESIPPPHVIAGVPVVLSLLLLCLLVARQAPAPDTNYGEIKSAFFVVSNLVFLVGGIFVGWSVGRLRLLLVATMVVSVAGALLLVLHFAGGGEQSILPVALTFSDGDHSISMGRQMAAGALIALAIVLGREDPATRLVAVTALPLLVAALLTSGSRGPIVGLILGGIVLLALGLSTRVARRRLILVGATAGATVLLVQALVPEASLVRSFSFATTDIEGSSSGRTEMWRQAWQAISERPELGVGTGGFADINPPMIYPHNIFLEAGVELGVAGVLLVAAFLAHATLRMLTAYRRGGADDRLLLAAILALFCAAVTNAMFSYALHTNWEVWMWAGVGTALAARVLTPGSRLGAERTSG